jgi:hypothetical protein
MNFIIPQGANQQRPRLASEGAYAAPDSRDNARDDLRGDVDLK